MTDLEAFLPKVLPLCPGCPEPVAFEHIRNAAIEFCEETKLWRFDDAFELGDEPNLVCAPQGSVIHQLERVDFNGRKLDPASIGWLDDYSPDWRSDTNMLTGEPKYFTQIEPDTIRVVPYKAGTVKVWLRLKPSEEADQLPDFIASQHRNLIGWGAVAGILMLPNQTFTDPNRATYYQAKFDQALGRKSKLQSTGQQRAPIRTKAQFF
ncbi:phage adaptor protein [Cupriavidus metallidurans]